MDVSRQRAFLIAATLRSLFTARYSDGVSSLRRLAGCRWHRIVGGIRWRNRRCVRAKQRSRIGTRTCLMRVLVESRHVCCVRSSGEHSSAIVYTRNDLCGCCRSCWPIEDMSSFHAFVRVVHASKERRTPPSGCFVWLRKEADAEELTGGTEVHVARANHSALSASADFTFRTRKSRCALAVSLSQGS